MLRVRYSSLLIDISLLKSPQTPHTVQLHIHAPDTFLLFYQSHFSHPGFKCCVTTFMFCVNKIETTEIPIANVRGKQAVQHNGNVNTGV